MRRPSLLKLIALSATMLGLCHLTLPPSAQAAPESRSIVPKSIAGMKMKYSDLHGNYVFSFAEDGTYSWTSGREGEKPEQRESGKYQWHLKSAGNAVLELSGNDTYTLTFDSPTHAKGNVTDDVRTYSFTFEK
jgi:hypothetical protein